MTARPARRPGAGPGLSVLPLGSAGSALARDAVPADAAPVDEATELSRQVTEPTAVPMGLGVIGPRAGVIHQHRRRQGDDRWALEGQPVVPFTVLDTPLDTCPPASA